MEVKEKEYDFSLAERFVCTARRNWQKRCICDSTGEARTYGQTLVSAVALSEQVERLSAGQEKIGILLPPSVGAVLANLAVTMLGKVAVNLNYSVSRELIDSAIKKCGIDSIITSRRFLQRFADLETLRGLVFIGDIVSKISSAARIRAYLKGRFMPAGSLFKGHRRRGDGLATIVFSSGSSGQPRGVMLSHRNIVSNIESLRTVFRLEPGDNLCGMLPFFHCFGYTCSLWLPIVSGVSASYVANPLDGGVVGRVVRTGGCTMLFATPTFLLNYIRRAGRGDFVGLRAVVVGAEKLRKAVADSFEQRFGIRPLEGYGTTELSPVVSLNLPDELGRGLGLSGHREGTVGRPIPGIELKIVHQETGREMAGGEEGLLMVKGPNVMLGYLGDPSETEKVLRNGWYNTGDMGRIDEDGFLTITGRLSRFSKIGGEMVPHLGLEEVYHRALGADEQVVVVTSVPHRQRGEELVVLYLDKAASADKLHEIVSKSTLPNIWKPRRDNYIKIESIPALGSGKLDVLRLQKIALAAKGDSEG